MRFLLPPQRLREGTRKQKLKQVSDTLRGMGLSVEDEFRCPKSGYSIDMSCTTCSSMQRAAQGLQQGGQWSWTGPLIF